MVFTTNVPYTIVFRHAQSGETVKDEIIIVGINTKLGRCMYKRRGIDQFLTLPASMDDVLAFQGHNHFFRTSNNVEKGTFSFVARKPEKLKDYIIDHCLNLNEQNRERIRINKPVGDLLHSSFLALHDLATHVPVTNDKVHFIELQHYSVTVEHDYGRFGMCVSTTSGEEAAIAQIMAYEKCPRSAIVNIKKVLTKYIF